MENKTEAQRVWSNMMAAANIMRNGVRDFVPRRAFSVGDTIHFEDAYWVTEQVGEECLPPLRNVPILTIPLLFFAPTSS